MSLFLRGIHKADVKGLRLNVPHVQGSILLQTLPQLCLAIALLHGT